MKISLASDLHLEFYDNPNNYWIPNHTSMDVLVLAGDIHTGKQALPWIKQHFSHVPYILYVLGNHEHYGSNNAIYKLARKMREYAAHLGMNNLHILDNNTIDIDGIRFIGSTLWTDFRLGGNQPLNMFNAKKEMNDYNFIRFTQQKIKAEQILQLNTIAKQYIFNNVNDNTIVITHHHPMIYNADMDSRSCYYYNSLDNEVVYSGIKYWFCGHTHKDVDYIVGETNVLTNMHGYIMHRKTPFTFKDIIV